MIFLNSYRTNNVAEVDVELKAGWQESTGMGDETELKKRRRKRARRSWSHIERYL